MITTILSYLFSTATFALFDYIHIEKRFKYVQHAHVTLARVATWFLIALDAALQHREFSIFITTTLVEWAFFWLLFDISLNLIRKKHILYIGYEAEIDLWYRRGKTIGWITIKTGIQRTYLLLLSKIILIIITLIIYFTNA